MFRRPMILALALGLGACAHDPMDYIPSTDRALLSAQSRLGEAGGGAGPVSVDEMLREVRGETTPPKDSAPAPDARDDQAPRAAMAPPGSGAKTSRLDDVPVNEDAASAPVAAAPGGAITVADLMRRARELRGPRVSTVRSDDEGDDNRVVLRFDEGALLPRDEYKPILIRFVETAQGRRLSVLSRRAGFDSGAALLGQRRAFSVARELSAITPDVDLRFDDETPPDVVVVTREAAAERMAVR